MIELCSLISHIVIVQINDRLEHPYPDIELLSGYGCLYSKLSIVQTHQQLRAKFENMMSVLFHSVW
jgi:hypothetical protein